MCSWPVTTMTPGSCSVVHAGSFADAPFRSHPDRSRRGKDHTLFFEEGREKTIALAVDHITSEFSMKSRRRAAARPVVPSEPGWSGARWPWPGRRVRAHDVSGSSVGLVGDEVPNAAVR